MLNMVSGKGKPCISNNFGGSEQVRVVVVVVVVVLVVVVVVEVVVVGGVGVGERRCGARRLGTVAPHFCA